MSPKDIFSVRGRTWDLFPFSSLGTNTLDLFWALLEAPWMSPSSEHWLLWRVGPLSGSFGPSWILDCLFSSASCARAQWTQLFFCTKVSQKSVSCFVSLNIREPDPSKEEARVKRSRIISVWVLENNSLCFETQITANFFSKLLHENILKRSTWFQEEIRTIPYGEPSACVIRTWQSNEGKIVNIDTSSFIFSTIKQFRRRS